jgi:hypothetical protein
VGQNTKRQLIHDLQSFLWQFERGGYSRDAMHEVLAKLEQALEDDGHHLGGAIEKHLQKMIQDCQAYANGGGDPLQIVKDLDQLRQDLEK